MRTFVITTSVRGSQRTQVWETSKPLALGHPFRWVLEQSENGVRVRNLAGSTTSKIEKAQVRELTFEELSRGAEIDVAPIKLKITPVVHGVPAFAVRERIENGTLQIFKCVGTFVLASEDLGASHVVSYEKKPAFRITKGSALQIKAEREGIVITQERSKRALGNGETLDLSSAQLIGTELKVGHLTYRFGLVRTPTFVDGHPTGRTELDQLQRNETEAFKRSMIYTGLGLLALIGLTLVWPKPQEDKELIPAQFTKIVMAQPKKAKATAPESGAAAQKLPKKVQDAAVVQAFRAKALNNAIHGLLKGGMTKLLAQSDFVAGTQKSSEARRIFDAKTETLNTTALQSGILNSHNVKVASLGGEGGGPAGSQVGYGKGEHAGVKGQGKGFVPFVSADADGSVVDDGLTKDEVGEVIHRHLSEIRYCYESAMVREPDIEGKLVTNFTIDGGGHVKSAEAKSSSLPDPRMDDCILRRLVTWQFPKPRGGVDVSVSYPFIFKTLGR
jgi:TonB family protein